MTYTEIVEHLAEHLEFPKTKIRQIIKQVTENCKQVLDNEKDITFPRLGTFQTKMRQKRKGFHPQLKQYMIIPKKRVVTFHAGTVLKDHVKNIRIEK